MRPLATLIVATGCATSLTLASAGAQTTESKTKIKAEDGKVVSYTGCVQTGTQTRTYVLQNVIPVAHTEATGTSGTTSSSTTYALVPGGTVQFQEHVGHKVEVTGVLVPGGKGDTKIKAKEKSKSGESETKAEIERGPMPQLKVVSVKPLAESCTPH